MENRKRYLVGLDIDDPDYEISKMENMIKHSVEPKIPDVHIKSIKLSKHAIIIRIGHSWISPHMVTLKGSNKFYSRTSNGKFPMDVSELRTAFTLTETINERIKNFRVDRISKISANSAPVLLNEDLKIIIHIIPINAFSSINYDLSEIEHKINILSKIFNKYSFTKFLQ